MTVLPSLRSSWAHFSSEACNSPALLFSLLSMSSVVRLAWSAVSCTLLTSASSSKAESFAMESWAVVCFSWSSRLETMFLSDITLVCSSFLSASTWSWKNPISPYSVRVLVAAFEFFSNSDLIWSGFSFLSLVLVYKSRATFSTNQR